MEINLVTTEYERSNNVCKDEWVSGEFRAKVSKWL